MNLDSKQDRQTRQIELVETYNLMRSLKRISETPGYGSQNWKRALYHAIAMSGCHGGFNEMEKIRQALGLP